MTYGNGDIPYSALVRVQSGLYLTPLAAESWFRIVAGVQQQFGWTPQLTDAFRTYAEQVRIFVDRYDAQATGGGYWGDVRWWNGVRYVRRRYRKSDGKVAAAAAVPGTSNHGNATAVDVADLGAFGSTRFNQFASVATRNGWSIAEGRSVGEPWHWTKNTASFANNPGQSVGNVPTVPGIDPIDPIYPEDDMYTDADRARDEATAEKVRELEVYTGADGVLDLQGWAARHTIGGRVIDIQNALTNALPVLLVAARGGDVDEDALAAALAPLLASSVVKSLSDADVAKIAKAAADEQDRRERARLGEVR